MNHEQQQTSDEELACAAQDGCMDSYEALVIRYERPLFHFLIGKIGNRPDAEDVTQTVFVKAYRNIKRYQPRYKFATWLYTIARREAISHYRTRKATVTLVEDPVETHTPAAALSAADERTQLWALARRELSDPQFNALWLRYEEDFSISEIARVLKRTQTSVKVMLHRARNHLHRVLVEARENEVPITRSYREGGKNHAYTF